MSEHYSRILHIKIIIGAKFWIKLTLLIFFEKIKSNRVFSI